MRFNRTNVAAIEIPPKGSRPIVVMDEETPGFGVSIAASGVRAFIVRYRVGGGRGAKMRQESLGRYPTTTPEKARQAAKNILAGARLGEDHAAAKHTYRDSMTVAELAAEWLSGPGKRTRTGRVKSDYSVANEKSRLDNHVVPVIGYVKLCELRRAHVEQVRDAVASGKTAKPRETTKLRGVRHVRGGEAIAARTVACLSTVLSYAVDHGYVAANVAKGVHTAAGKRRERFLSPDEIKALDAALSARAGHAVHILRLLLLTGCRFNEIAGLKWSEVHLVDGLIMLADSKTGARPVFLSDAATAELEKVRRLEGSPWVFPATRGKGHYKGTKPVWRAVLAEAGLSGVRVHDLRHSFASVALANGASLPEIAELLGHKELRTTARYSHLAADAVRRVANRVGQAVTGS